MHRRTVAVLVLALLVALTASACGKKGADPAPTAGPTPAATSPAGEATRVPPASVGTTPGAPGASATTAPAGAHDDAKSGADAPDEAARALAVKAGAPISGLLPEGDTGDWYTLDVPHGSLIDLAFTPASGGTGLTVELYDANGYVVWSQQDHRSGTAKARYIVSDVEGGQYGVRVSGGEGAYEWQAAVAPQDDGGSGKDAGGDRAGAVTAKSGGAAKGLLGDSDLDDWYTLDVAGGSVLTVALQPEAGAKVSVYVQGPEAYDLWSAYDVVPREGAALTLLVADDEGGEYAVHVQGAGAYTLEAAAMSQNDGGSGGDAGGELAGGVPVRVGKPFAGIVGDTDYADYYTFDVPAGAVLSVTVTTAKGSEEVDVELYDFEEVPLWSEYGVRAGQPLTMTVIVGAESGGQYALGVRSGPAAYQVEVSTTTQDDGGSGGDAGDELGEAVEIVLDEEYSGLQGDSDWADWYTFTLEDGEAAEVTVTVPKGQGAFLLQVFDEYEDCLESLYDISSRNPAAIEVDAGMGQTFYVQVADGAGPYTLKVVKK
jgi:hypothetical protein